nr:hypothetical protein [Tanacetum cinerariifolium]
LRLSSLAVNAVFSAQAFNVDVQMQFSHTRNDSLLGLGIDVDAEGRIFAGEAVHGFTEVGGIFGVFGPD